MVFYLTGTGNCLMLPSSLKKVDLARYQRKFPVATPLRKQDGGYAMFYETHSARALGILAYIKSRPVSHVIAIRPPAYQAYCGGTVNWSLSQGVVGEPSLLLSPVAAGDPKMPTIFERMEQLGNSKPVLCHLKNGFQFQNDVVHLTQRISL